MFDAHSLRIHDAPVFVQVIVSIRFLATTSPIKAFLRGIKYPHAMQGESRLTGVV